MPDGKDPSIVFKAEAGPALSAYEARTFQKPKHGEQMTFEVNLVAESLDGMKKRAVVEPNLPTWSSFTIMCDEGTALGGEDTAPPPLGYLSAGIAFCLLTHLTAFIRAKKLNVDSLKVEQRTNFRTTLVTDAEQEGDFKGMCDSVETFIIVDSSEAPETIQELTRISQNACMAMQSIMNATPTNTKILLNGQTL